MKTKIWVLIELTFLFSFLTARSQQSLYPPTPEGAALSKFINYPVSLNTGVPSINIPLYNVVCGNMQMPIVLDYHASGIKVNEQSTWVGLGWNLNLEPEITRQINGKPDESGYLANTSVYEYSPNRSLGSAEALYWVGLAGDIYDEEPDRFNYRLLSGSGTFMFQKHRDRAAEAVTIPYRPIKIEWVNNINFKVTDMDGTCYVFDVIGTSSANIVVTTSTMITSWKCSKIISPDKVDTITFMYEQPRISNTFRHDEKVVVIDSTFSNYVDTPRPKIYDYSSATQGNPSTTLGQYYSAGMPGGFSRFFDDDGFGGWKDISVEYLDSDPQWVRASANENSLKNISFKQGHVNFYSVPNHDSGSKLDSIKVFANSGDLIKKIIFCLRDINPNGHQQNIYPNDNRIGLDSLLLFGSDRKKEKYEFGYNYPAIINRWIKFSDPWGYYNTDGSSSIGTFQGFSVPFIYNISVVDTHRTWGLSFPDPIHFNFDIGGSNNDPYEPAMKSFILNKIIYPTGGRSEYEYSSNRYMAEDGSVKLAGGLRVDKIKFFSDKTATTSLSEKIYKYGENEDGVGEIKITPDISTYSYEQEEIGTRRSDSYIDFGERRKRTFVSKSFEDLFYDNGCPVNYTKITEYQKDNGTTSGKTVYDFSPFPLVGPVGSFRNSTNYPGTYLTINKIDIDGGQLLGIIDYAFKDNVFRWIKNSTNEYLKILRPDKINVGKIFPNVVYLYDSEAALNTAFQNYTYINYGQDVGDMYLINKEEKTRSLTDSNAVAISNTHFYYDNPDHLLPTRIEKNQSDGTVNTLFTTYPQDYLSGTQFIDNMKVNHLLSYPIEQINYKSSADGLKILSGNLNLYKAVGNGLLDKKYTIENDKPIYLSGFKFSNQAQGILPNIAPSQTFTPDPSFKEKVSYDLYDGFSNPSQITTNTADKTSYLWGYDHKYLIASCKNGSNGEFVFLDFDANQSIASNYSVAHTGKGSYNGSIDLSSILIPTFHGRSYELSYFKFDGAKWGYISAPYVGQTINGILDDIRIYPEDAEMTTYTYKPLVGMSSMTDPAGHTTYYDYDSFQRLLDVRDQDGNIVRSNDYHYRPQ